MTLFYVVAGGMALGTAVALALPLLRGMAEAETRGAKDARLYRDQLAEIERDAARGLIGPAEAEGARAEISRRLIAAADRGAAETAAAAAPRGVSGLVAGLTLMAAPVLAGVVYLATGAPGLPDRPLAAREAELAAAAPAAPAAGRPSQEAAERQFGQPPSAAATQDAEYAALVARLEQTVAERPRDAEGLRLLAAGLVRLERFGEAWRQFAALISLLGPEAEAELFAQQAEAMVLAAGGYVSPEAERVIGEALARDAGLPMARYYAGLSLAQNGMVDDAVVVWEKLKGEAPADAAWLPWLDVMLAEAQRMRDQGVPGAAPAPGGPTPEDIAAAEAMTPDERMAMVRGMVERLETRLTTQGGSAEEWAQLINSHAALGDQAAAARAWDAARTALADSPDLAALTDIARGLGLVPGGDALREGGAIALPTPAAPGPGAAEVEAAAAMTPEDRAAMIAGMVARLETRLTTEGGTVEEWYRLMTSYMTLQQPEAARRVYDLAQAALGPGGEAGFLREQALTLGVIPE